MPLVLIIVSIEIIVLVAVVFFLQDHKDEFLFITIYGFNLFEVNFIKLFKLIIKLIIIKTKWMYGTLLWLDQIIMGKCK